MRFTLIQFDTANPCEVVYDRVRLDDVGPITLTPRGGTPLLDAMGRALDHLTKYNPEEVIVMVITDGEENESREWTCDRIKARVTELEAKDWKFLFLGANIDAFAEAGGLGIGVGTTVAFAQGRYIAQAKHGRWRVTCYRYQWDAAVASDMAPTTVPLAVWDASTRAEAVRSIQQVTRALIRLQRSK